MSVVVQFKPVSVTRTMYDEVIKRVDGEAGGRPNRCHATSVNGVGTRGNPRIVLTAAAQ
jgi:hypothetical protein